MLGATTMSNDTPYEEDDDVTTIEDARWTYIGTVLAGIMVISLAVLVIGAAAGVLQVSPIGRAWFGLYALVTLMAATWAFGEETLNAVQRVRNK